MRESATASIWSTPEFDAYVETLLSACHPLSEEREALARFYGRELARREIDGAGRVIVPVRMLEAQGIAKDGRRQRRPPTGSSAGSRDTWARGERRADEKVRDIRPALGNTLDMTATHVPVLAGSLCAALRARPGGDRRRCDAGCGGHARPSRRSASGRGHADRDRSRSGRRRALREPRRGVDAGTRFIAASFVEGLRTLRDEGLEADAVYFDLGLRRCRSTPATRLLLLLRCAARHANGPAPIARRARDRDEWDERRLAQIFRDYGEERYARPSPTRSRLRARTRRRSRRRSILVEIVFRRASPRRLASPAATPRSGPSRRSGSPSTMSSVTRCRLPLAWQLRHRWSPRGDLIPTRSRPAREAVPRRAGERCKCPPAFPVCVCGRQPRGSCRAACDFRDGRRARDQPARRQCPSTKRAQAGARQ